MILRAQRIRPLEYRNIANLYSEKENYTEASKYYQTSLELCQELGIEYGVILNQYNLGIVYFKQGELNRSEPFLLSSYDYFKSTDSKVEQNHAANYLYELYNTLGKQEETIFYLLNYIDIREELFEVEKLDRAESLRVKYETDLKDQQLLLTQTELQLSEAEVREKAAANRNLILLVVLLGVILCGSALYYYRRLVYLRALFDRNMELMRKEAEVVAETVGREGVTDPEKKESLQRGDVGKKASEVQRDQAIFEQIKTVLRKEAPFKDPNFLLQNLCRRVGTNEKYVSSAIHTCTGMYFSHYINHLRVTEAKQQILSGATSMGEVQYLSGFNSRTTFYTAFKKNTGMSPTEFMKQNERQKQRQKSSLLIP